MHLTPAHVAPLVALIAGILILIVPRLLNYIVAIYLIIIGLDPSLPPAPTRVLRDISAFACLLIIAWIGACAEGASANPGYDHPAIEACAIALVRGH